MKKTCSDSRTLKGRCCHLLHSFYTVKLSSPLVSWSSFSSGMYLPALVATKLIELSLMK